MHTLRCGGGRHVEGPGRGGAPIHQQRIVLRGRCRQPDPADVVPVAVAQIQAPEAQPTLRRIEPGQLPGRLMDDRIPFGAGLRGAAGVPPGLGQPGRRLRTKRIEPAVEHRHVRLLPRDFRFR